MTAQRNNTPESSDVQVADISVQDSIFTLRGEKVILDSDLAAIYGVETKRLNEQVRRNAHRFPSDFAFILAPQEVANLRSQIATSSLHGGRRYSPRVFTEHGALMAANVLNSKRAVEMSVFVVRAFTKMRSALSDTRELARKLSTLEREVKARLDSHDAAIVDVMQRILDRIDPPEHPDPQSPPQRKIGFSVKERSAKYGTPRRTVSGSNSGAGVPPANLREAAGTAAPQLFIVGDAAILDRPKIALFCSVKCPGKLILETYDLAKRFRAEGVLVISPFHSPMEQECLRILLRSPNPIIWALARGAYRQIPSQPVDCRNAAAEGRLIMVTPFPDRVRHITAETATTRNQLVAKLADAVVVAHAAPGSKMEALCRDIIAAGKPLYTFDNPANAALLESGAKSIASLNLGAWSQQGSDDRFFLAEQHGTPKAKRSQN